MTPVTFPGANTIIGKGQEDLYIPLPAQVIDATDGIILTCWKLSFWERVKLFFTGRVWHSVMTFNHGYQPQRLTIDRPLT